MSTSTPSGDQTSSMAAATRSASVPSGLPGCVETAGDPDAQALAAHLRGQLRHALGELRAVADQDQSDHGGVPGASGPCHARRQRLARPS